MYRLALADAQWPRVKPKLCHCHGQSYLEFRQMSGWSDMFVAWPGQERPSVPMSLIIIGTEGHAVRPVGCWAPKETPIAVTQTSGRQRLNVHGAIDLETG